MVTIASIGDPGRIAYSLHNVGNILLKQHDYYKALQYCKKGYELAVAAGILEIQRKTCRCLYDTYKALGKRSNALEYHELLNAVEGL